MSLYSAFIAWLILNELFVLAMLRKLWPCGNSRARREKKQGGVFNQ